MQTHSTQDHFSAITYGNTIVLFLLKPNDGNDFFTGWFLDPYWAYGVHFYCDFVCTLWKSLSTAVTFFHLFYIAHLKVISDSWAQMLILQFLFRTKTCFFCVMVQTWGVSNSTFYSIALMNITRMWLGSHIVWCSFCLIRLPTCWWFLKKQYYSCYCVLSFIKRESVHTEMSACSFNRQRVSVYFVGSSSVYVTLLSLRLIGSHSIDVEPRASVVLRVQPVANESHMPSVFLITMLFRLSSCSLWNLQAPDCCF